MVIEKQSNHSAVSRKAFWIITSTLFVIAIALRWVRLDLMTFRYDQAAIAFRAMETFRSGLPLTGIVNSMGFHNGPGYVWTLLPAFLITPDPRLATALHGLIAATIVFPLALLGRRYRNDMLLWLPAILAALLPASVFAGRNMWAQFLLPPIICWSILMLDSALDPARSWRERRRSAAICLGLLAWGVSVHFSAAALFAVAAGFITVTFARRWRDLVTALLPAAFVGLTILPSLLDAYSQFTRPREKPQFAAEYEAILPDPLPWFVRVPDSVLWSFSNSSTEALFGIEAYFSSLTTNLIAVFDTVVLLLIAAGGLYGIVTIIRHRNESWTSTHSSRRLATVLLAWVVIPAAAGGLLVPRVNAGYYVGSLPAGWLMVLLLPAPFKIWRYVANGIVVFAAAGALYITCLFIATIQKTGYIPGSYYLTYERQAEVVRYLASKNIPVTRVTHLSGDWFEHSYNYIHKYLEAPPESRSRDTRQFALVEDKNVRPDQPKRLSVFWALEPAEFGSVGVKLMPSRGAAETFVWQYYELPLE